MSFSLSLLLMFTLSATSTDDTLASARQAAAAGNTSEARSLYEKALSDPSQKLDALLALAELLANPQDFEQAVIYGQQATEAAPDSAQAHYVYALALVAKTQFGNMFTAGQSAADFLKEIRRAIELDGKHVAAREQEMFFYLMAPAMVGGSEEHAMKLAEELTTVNRGRGLLAQGRILQRQKKGAEALALMREAAPLLPGDLEVLFAMGMLEFELGDYTAAIATFDKGTDTSSKYYPNLLYQRARARLMAKTELDKALTLLEEYLPLREKLSQSNMPSASSAYWRIGQIHEAQGNLDRAREAYTKGASYEKADPHNQERLDALKVQ